MIFLLCFRICIFHCKNNNKRLQSSVPSVSFRTLLPLLFPFSSSQYCSISPSRQTPLIREGPTQKCDQSTGTTRRAVRVRRLKGGRDQELERLYPIETQCQYQKGEVFRIPLSYIFRTPTPLNTWVTSPQGPKSDPKFRRESRSGQRVRSSYSEFLPSLLSSALFRVFVT